MDFFTFAEPVELKMGLSEERLDDAQTDSESFGYGSLILYLFVSNFNDESVGDDEDSFNEVFVDLNQQTIVEDSVKVGCD